MLRDVPGANGRRRAAISEAARRLDELRRSWLAPEGVSEAGFKKRTLTNLYNARPTRLNNAHKKLDAAVFAAYGWPEGISDEDILKNLLALNLERSGPEFVGKRQPEEQRPGTLRKPDHLAGRRLADPP